MACLRYLAFFLFTILLLAPTQAPAQERTKTFAVLPFTINGPDKYRYLGRGIQDMMISRLTWDEKLEHIGKDKVAEQFSTAPASAAEAKVATTSLDTDYVVWGSVTILGEDASVDVQVADASGNSWPQTASAPLSKLIPILEGVAKDINAKIFDRGTATGAAPAASVKPAKNKLNPELVHNETTTGQEYYLNPQFRYAGGAANEGRWRSPAMPFAANGMIATDADGDGQVEMFFISGNKLYAYRVVEDEFLPLAEITLSSRALNLNISAMDINNDGTQEIIVSGVLVEEWAQDQYHKDPNSFIVSFKDNSFTIIAKNLRYFLNATKMAPTYRPVLLGQKKGKVKFFEERAHEVVFMDGEYKLGKRIGLPDKANVFNITYLPTEDGGYKILIVDEQDQIRVYNENFELQSTTMDKYAGSGVGIRIPDTVEGFSTHKDQYKQSYYVPLRLIVDDVDKDGKFEVITNKNISLAALFFQSYRTFPNGELHALNWDGVGLALAWKTRRLKGTVVDYGIADINNDGVLDLYTCMNTYPGPAGVERRKAMVLAFPLDVSKQDLSIQTSD